MRATNELLHEYQDARAYRERAFRSKSNPTVIHRAAILYGGTMERPNWDCDCTGFQFNKRCWHVEELWNELTGFQRAIAVHEGFTVNGKQIR